MRARLVFRYRGLRPLGGMEMGMNRIEIEVLGSRADKLEE